MLKRALILAAVGAAVSCGKPQLNYGPFVQHFGCDPHQVRERAIENVERSGHWRDYYPQVGWDACQLFAHNLIPGEMMRGYDEGVTEPTIVLAFEPRGRCDAVAGLRCKGQWLVTLRRDEEGTWRVSQVN